MSAPDTNALPPAPVTTTTRMFGSLRKSSRMPTAASHMSSDTALCRSRIVEDHVADAAFLARQHLLSANDLASGNAAVAGVFMVIILAFSSCPASCRRIHALASRRQGVDGRDKPGHDDRMTSSFFKPLSPCCSAAISLALKPNSLSTSSVCSPSPGGRTAILLGVRDSVTGWPTRPSGLPSGFGGSARCRGA